MQARYILIVYSFFKKIFSENEEQLWTLRCVKREKLIKYIILMK